MSNEQRTQDAWEREVRVREIEDRLSQLDRAIADTDRYLAKLRAERLNPKFEYQGLR